MSEGKAPQTAADRSGALTTLLACAIGLTFSLPVFLGSTAVLMIPIANDTGWSRGDVSALIGSGLFGYAIGTAICGRAIEKWGPHHFIIAMSIIFGLSLGAFGIAKAYWLALAISVVIGISAAGTSQFAYFTALPLWFDHRLGMSFGIGMLGNGIGTIFTPLVIERLSALMHWRMIYGSLGLVIILVALPNVLLLYRMPPGQTVTKLAAATGTQATGGLRAALRGRTLWVMGLSFFLATAVAAGFGIHLVSFMVDMGRSPAEAARIFAIWGGVILVARLVGGILLDHFDPRWLGGGFMLCAALGAMALAQGVGGAATVLAVCCIAMAHGFDGDLVPYMTRRYFGLAHYGQLLSALGFSFCLGSVLGTILMGMLFDLLGSYVPLLWVIGVIIGLAALLLFSLGPPPSRLSPKRLEDIDGDQFRNALK